MKHSYKFNVYYMMCPSLN